MKEIELLNQVNEFYNSAWDKLLISQLDDKNYYDATRSYAMAIDYYRSAKNFMAIQDILPNLTDCLKKIKKPDINELKKEDDIDLDEILFKVLKRDKYGIVRIDIIDGIYRKFDYFDATSLLTRLRKSKDSIE
jgi:hypothetical protein